MLSQKGQGLGWAQQQNEDNTILRILIQQCLKIAGEACHFAPPGACPIASPHILLAVTRLLFLFLNWLMGSGETFGETFHNKLLKVVITLAP